MPITDRIRSLVTAADLKLSARGLSCSATFGNGVSAAEVDEAEKRLGRSLPQPLRDLYLETSQIVVGIIEVASGRAKSGFTLENLGQVVEQTELIRACIKR